MNDSQLTTGWFCVATEGATIDGRYIDPAWLKDMGATYNPARYTALIWGEHKRNGDNLGKCWPQNTRLLKANPGCLCAFVPRRNWSATTRKGKAVLLD